MRTYNHVQRKKNKEQKEHMNKLRTWNIVQTTEKNDSKKIQRTIHTKHHLK